MVARGGTLGSREIDGRAPHQGVLYYTVLYTVEYRLQHWKQVMKELEDESAPRRSSSHGSGKRIASSLGVAGALNRNKLTFQSAVVVVMVVAAGAT